MSHLRQAVRQLALRPGLSGTVIVMLALGIGATTAIFSLFYQVLMRPLPVPDPETLVNVAWTGPEAAPGGEALSYPMFRDLEAGQAVFTGLAGYTPFSASLASDEGPAASLQGVSVTGGYFATLNLRPALGRLIDREDEPRVDESPVVVLSHGLWQSRFGGEPDIVGRVLTVNGTRLTVVGVAPERFAGTRLGLRAQLFVPITMRWQLDPSMPREAADNRSFSWVFAFARLGSGVTVDQAVAGINGIYGRVLREVEAPLQALHDDELEQFLDRRLELAPGARGQGAMPDAEQSLTLLLGVTLLVLSIVCVNVANLLLARGASRAAEMAIRESIGATRGRLVAQLMTEAAVPALLGGLLSLPVAALTLAAIAPTLPPWLADTLTMQVGLAAALFAAVATVATTIAAGLFPALRTARTSPAGAMKGQAAQALGGHGAARVRTVLVTAQMALSLVLLVLAGLFAKSLLNVARIDLGLDVDSLVSFSVAPRLNGYDLERAAVLYRRIQEELAVQPGVVDVAFAAVPVISGGDFESFYFLESEEREEPSVAKFNMVGPGFFETLSIPLLAGREFTLADGGGFPSVTIVNERFLREHGLGADAVGEYVTFGPDAPRMEIVGVAADAAYSQVKGEVPPVFFVPHGYGGGENPIFTFLLGSLSFYVRAAIEPETLLGTIPGVVASIDPTLPVDDLTTMRRQARERIFVDRLVTMLSVSFAVLATLLAAIGLHGVLAYSVAQRRRELGIRLALGAEPGDLRAMVLRQVAVLASLGIAIGLVAALGAGRIAEALLYGLPAHDPTILAAAVVVLGAVVLAASYVPARRASNVAPMDALRHE
jgi:predicted permease